MRWMDKMRRMVVTLLHRGQETRRLDQEMQFHLDQAIGERVAGGASPREARKAAIRDFGNPAVLREEAQRNWSWNWLETLVRDLRFGLRGLMRSPGFSVTAI